MPARWTFRSKEVAAAFDSHVREQLPWYDLATGVVAHIVRSYLPEQGLVVDVGASTGNVGRAIAPVLDERHASIVPLDSSPEMATVYEGPGRLRVGDALDFDWTCGPDVVIAFLVLMFVPVPRRADLIETIKASIRPGGAFIVFDKLQPQPGYLGTVAYRLTLAAKHEAGASSDEIIAKELSISGVQRPMRADELVGFAEVFRFGDFAGFVWERV